MPAQPTYHAAFYSNLCSTQCSTLTCAENVPTVDQILSLCRQLHPLVVAVGIVVVLTEPAQPVARNLGAHWSNTTGQPTLACHKDTAQATQIPQLGELLSIHSVFMA